MRKMQVDSLADLVRAAVLLSLPGLAPDVNAPSDLGEAWQVLLGVADQAPGESDERNRAVGEIKEGTG